MAAIPRAQVASAQVASAPAAEHIAHQLRTCAAGMMMMMMMMMMMKMTLIVTQLTHKSKERKGYLNKKRKIPYLDVALWYVT